MAAAAPASSRADGKRKARRFRQLGLPRRCADRGGESAPRPRLCLCLTREGTEEAQQTRRTARAAGSAAHSKAAPLLPPLWALPAAPAARSVALPGAGMWRQGGSRAAMCTLRRARLVSGHKELCLPQECASGRLWCHSRWSSCELRKGDVWRTWWRRLISPCGNPCPLAMENSDSRICWSEPCQQP